MFRSKSESNVVYKCTVQLLEDSDVLECEFQVNNPVRKFPGGQGTAQLYFPYKIPTLALLRSSLGVIMQHRDSSLTSDLSPEKSNKFRRLSSSKLNIVTLYPYTPPSTPNPDATNVVTAIC